MQVYSDAVLEHADADDRLEYKGEGFARQVSVSLYWQILWHQWHVILIIDQTFRRASVYDLRCVWNFCGVVDNSDTWVQVQVQSQLNSNSGPEYNFKLKRKVQSSYKSNLNLTLTSQCDSRIKSFNSVLFLRLKVPGSEDLPAVVKKARHNG